MSYYDLHHRFDRIQLNTAVWWIILISGATLILQQMFGSWLAYHLGFVPVLVRTRYWIWQPFTFLFLHGGLFHWFFNMIVVWMFGTQLEQRWGTKEFLKYFFLTGVGSALCVFILTPNSSVPTMGASGAVFGMIVAFAFLFPNAVMYSFFIMPMKVWHAVILFAFIEVYFVFAGGGEGIVRFAHLAGMAIGYFYLKFGDPFRIQFNQFIRRRPRDRRRIELHEVTDELVQRVDHILDKVLKEGVESLTPEEKRIMDRYSKNKH